MSTAKALNKLTHLKFTTADEMPLEAIVDHFLLMGLSIEINKTYVYMAEVISNIYEHAVLSENEAVDWSLLIEIDDNKLIITIEDQGRGINDSLSCRFGKKISQLESLNLAINKCSVRPNRGRGLNSILHAVSSGILISVLVESDGYKFRGNKNDRIFNKGAKLIGTRVQVSVDRDGGSQ